MKNYTKFNINSEVLIKLNKIGYERLVENHNQFIEIIPRWQEKTIEDFEKLENENGYYRIQLHKCFELFHDLIYNGAKDLPFKMNILINNNDLEDENE